jgi:hypothetical protein
MRSKIIVERLDIYGQVSKKIKKTCFECPCSRAKPPLARAAGLVFSDVSNPLFVETARHGTDHYIYRIPYVLGLPGRSKDDNIYRKYI